jgi:hypothetical protein
MQEHSFECGYVDGLFRDRCRRCGVVVVHEPTFRKTYGAPDPVTGARKEYREPGAPKLVGDPAPLECPGPKMRWDCVAADAPGAYGKDGRFNFNVESPPNVEAFLADIFAVYRKHQLTIGHEDGHGGFLIREFDEGNIEWLDGASMDIRVKENV